MIFVCSLFSSRDTHTHRGQFAFLVIILLKEVSSFHSKNLNNMGVGARTTHIHFSSNGWARGKYSFSLFGIFYPVIIVIIVDIHFSIVVIDLGVYHTIVIIVVL